MGGESAGHPTSAIKILRVTATKARVEFLNKRLGPTASAPRGTGHGAGTQRYLDLEHLINAYRPAKGD